MYKALQGLCLILVLGVLVAPPGSRLGPMDPAERVSLMRESLVRGIYDEAVDRVSAYEILQQRAEQAAAVDALAAGRKAETKPRSRSSSRQTPLEAFVSSTARSGRTRFTTSAC